jgi:hypothetical protein
MQPLRSDRGVLGTLASGTPAPPELEGSNRIVLRRGQTLRMLAACWIVVRRGAQSQK